MILDLVSQRIHGSVFAGFFNIPAKSGCEKLERRAVLNSLTSLDAQRGYRHAIDEFVDWYCSEPRLAFNRIVVLRFGLISNPVNLHLAPSTYVSVPCAHTRPPTAVSSAPIWRLVFAVLKA